MIIYIAYLNDDDNNHNNKQKSCLKTLKADWHSQLGNAGKLIKIFKNHYKVFFGGVGGAHDGGGPIFKLIPLPLLSRCIVEEEKIWRGISSGGLK